MSADGTWKLTVQTPIGERKSTLTLQGADGAPKGRLAGEEGNATDIFDAKAGGDGLSWKANITNPMPLTLEFTATIAGDTMAGTVNASGMGSWPFSGTRA